MLFNILLTLNICAFIFFIIYLFIYHQDCNESFNNNKKYVSKSDHIDSLKSKYYILKGGEDEKSLLSKIKLYSLTK